MTDFSTQIKTALKAAGLGEDLFDQIKVEKEEDIGGAVDTLKKEIEDLKTLSGEEFLKAVDKAGLSEPLKKYIASEADRRITKALKTHDDKLAKDAQDVKDKLVEDDKNKSLTTDQKEIASLHAKNKELDEKINSILQKTSEGDISSTISKALKEANLDEGFAKNISVKTVEEVGDAVKDLSERILSGQQQKIDKILEEAGVPANGKGRTSTQTEAAIANFAENKNKGEGGGGIIAQQNETKK